MRNLLVKVARSAQGIVATAVRTIFAQPDATSTHCHFELIVERLRTRFPEAAALLEGARGDLLGKEEHR